MKKFFAVVLTLAILAGGYLVLSGQVRLFENPIREMSRMVSTSGKAERSSREESALDGAKRVDEQIWSGIRYGRTEEVVSILQGMGYTREEAESFVSALRENAVAMNKRHVHIISESGDVCAAEAVHYLVTFTNGKKDWSESNCNYTLSLRKVDGKWEPTELSEEEAEVLDNIAAQAYKPEAVEAANAGRNMTRFGNLMWMQADGVEEGALITELAYMYQEENGDVVAVIKIANGEDIIRNMDSISLTVEDDNLGQVLKQKDRANARVLPGTVKLYEMRIPASKVKKGTWTSMHFNIHTDY